MIRWLRVPSTGRGLLFVMIAATSWGVGGFVAALLHRSGGLGLVAVSFWRFVGGLVLLTTMRPLVKRRQRWTATPGQLVLTGIGFAVYQTAYYAAVPLAGLAAATIVTLGLGPVLIAVGSRLFLSERLGLRGVTTIGVAVLGLVLLTVDGGAGSSPTTGLLLSVLSATGYAGVTLLRRGRNGDDPYDAALGGFGVAALCVLPLALLEGELRPPAHDLGWIAFLGVVPTALAYALFFVGLAAVRATTASLVALVEPLTAALLAIFVLHEQLTLVAAAGGLLLLGAVALRAVEETRSPGSAPGSTDRSPADHAVPPSVAGSPR